MNRNHVGIFRYARRGDLFKTRDGRQAIYDCCSSHEDIHYLLVEEKYSGIHSTTPYDIGGRTIPSGMYPAFESSECMDDIVEKVMDGL